MKSKILFLLALSLNCLVYSQSLFQAPDFSLVSGAVETITLDDFQGKLILCFYDSRDSENANNKLKNMLKQYEESIDLAILAVADCSSAKWPLINLWNKALISKSEEYGYTVYGDWDGSMLRSYNLEKNASNIILIDKAKNVIYQHSGQMNDEEIDRFLTLLTSAIVG
ncbi:MAG: redoxin domain-containing protein [Spirochaetaceae bacterium]|jgi:peroxiredoxin|nr:redoxin domain-containing protein [Spirochaetaceae bacterium]